MEKDDEAPMMTTRGSRLSSCSLVRSARQSGSENVSDDEGHDHRPRLPLLSSIGRRPADVKRTAAPFAEQHWPYRPADVGIGDPL